MPKPKKKLTPGQKTAASRPGAFTTRKGGPIRNVKDERKEDFGPGGWADLYAKGGGRVGRVPEGRVTVLDISHPRTGKKVIRTGQGMTIRTVSRTEAEKMKQSSYPKATKKKATKKKAKK